VNRRGCGAGALVETSGCGSEAFAAVDSRMEPQGASQWP
jgi:hypothetical protein